MNTKSLLHDTAHRPFPPPSRPWVMTQIWHDLLFLHWPIEPRLLRPAVPEQLDLDIFGGTAWLAIVPFWMTGIRLRWMPPIPWASGFPELNVRTYVRHRDRPGVYFMSLDAPHRLLSAIARRWFHLPYVGANVSIERGPEWIAFQSRRRGPASARTSFEVRYRPNGPPREASTDAISQWMVERYRLYTTDRSDRVWSADIHHRVWSLQPAAVELSANTLPAAHGLAVLDRFVTAHYAKYMEVLVWSPRQEPSAARRRIFPIYPALSGSGKSR